MFRYGVQLFGLTIFAMALIWFAGPGEAVQNTRDFDRNLWADTSEIYPSNQGVPEVKTDEGMPVLDKRDTFMQNVKKLTQTAFNIRNQYMEDVDVDKMIKAGINGMLSDLDRFSVLMEKTAYDNLMESTHGKYEGLGMQIDSREDRVVIISPIEGTPAYRKGLRAGDIIWEINGQPTLNMKTSDASKLMRGTAGTTVKLLIKRSGIAELLEYEVERAVIQLKSVNYAGLIPGTNIGYVRLSRFAEETSHELRTAISELNEKNISGLIFDLRSNGGGLLDQAKETAELFLKEGREIVYTKGRYDNSERHFVSERPPLFPDKPLVILVDEGTASASEIVSGAIQDWDRGLIIGNTTYGKGLVQQVFPISNDGDLALKLTTAKYYVPSGRCIQKPEKQMKHPGTASSEEEEAIDSLAVSHDEIYYTNGGRIVYGGGGIVPDVEVERELWKPIEINLERKSMFFDFAVKYVSENPGVKPDFEVTDNIISDFKKFIREKDFTYKTSIQVALEELEETMKDEKQDTLFAGSIDQMKQMVEKEKESDFNESLDYIKRAIKREIVSSIAGERGVYEEIVLKSDNAVKKALEILTTPDTYTRLMTKGQNKTES
ncbi:MAG: S41 family peptidase [candidate division Zixibacteria bacterium]|nr:S41 family peptidase [candidate division Zixibacteria bacterium]MDD5425682.1 S41 family peptidase [candidate division Zixibacteria bacterium]